jgi:hypothetical protein
MLSRLSRPPTSCCNAPGTQTHSPADIEDAETLWGFMQTISRMVLKRDDEAAPAA